jgi:hypothetical protein
MKKIILIILLILLINIAIAQCTITNFSVGNGTEKYFKIGQSIPATISFEGNCDGNVLITQKDRINSLEPIEIYNSRIISNNMSVMIIPSFSGIMRFEASYIETNLAENQEIISVASDETIMGDIINMPIAEPFTDIIILEERKNEYWISFVSVDYNRRNPSFNEYTDFNILGLVFNEQETPTTNVPVSVLSSNVDLNIFTNFIGNTDFNMYVDLLGWGGKYIWWHVDKIKENTTITLTVSEGDTFLADSRDVNAAPQITLLSPISDYNSGTVSFDYNLYNPWDLNYCTLFVDGVEDQNSSNLSELNSFTKKFENYGKTHSWDINCITITGHDYYLRDNIWFKSLNGPVDFNLIGFLGEGTEESPYEIKNCVDLQNVRNFLDSNFVLTQDINCIEVNNWDNNKGFESIGRDYNGDGELSYSELFSGTLDGNYYSINNLYINRPNENRVGLFGYLHPNAKIKRIGLEDVNIFGKMRVGGLVGENYGIITESFSTGNVYGVYAVGGLVGNNANLVEKSYSDANVEANAMPWGAYVGGLVGWNLSKVSNSYATGTIKSNRQGAAGLVGVNYQTPGFNTSIINSYSIANVISTDGKSLVENIIGTIVSSYWDSNISTKGGEGTGKMTEELFQQSTFIDWDFNSIWDINGNYPYLKWEIN